MSSIVIQNLSYRFDNGNTLFSSLNMTFEKKVTGLVGRNGVGKSVLASLLAGEKSPTSGSIVRYCRVGRLSQISAQENRRHYGTIGDYLGVRDKLLALSRIAQGKCETDDVELVGDSWLLLEDIQQQLQALGLPPDPFLPCQALSGGQLTRLALHQLFSADYGYLILDEPSNHLDEQGKTLLTEQMRRFSGGVLVISHDRGILRYVDDILELSGLGMRHYGGAYEFYAQQRARELANQEQRIEQAKSRIRHLRNQIQKNQEKAHQRARQGKQLARSGSQAKILLNNKKQDAERAGGSRENGQNRHLAHIQEQLGALSERHEALKRQCLTMGGSEKRVSNILSLNAVRLPYVGKGPPITFTVEYGDKVHISGANGCGKSTLLNVIAGKLQPLGGNIRVCAGLCYLDQHYTLLDNHKSAQENLAHFCPRLTQTDQRTLLAGVGLRRERANQSVATLSGGEKMKVAMLAVSHQPGDTLLLLDEPDNHLDLDSKQILAQALRDFTGSLLLVCHDRDFVMDVGVTAQVCLDE